MLRFSIAMQPKRLFTSRSLRWSRARVFSLMFVEGSRNQQQMSSHASLLFPCHVSRLELSVFTALSLFIKFCAALSVHISQLATEDTVRYRTDRSSVLSADVPNV